MHTISSEVYLINFVSLEVAIKACVKLIQHPHHIHGITSRGREREREREREGEGGG